MHELIHSLNPFRTADDMNKHVLFLWFQIHYLKQQLPARLNGFGVKLFLMEKTLHERKSCNFFFTNLIKIEEGKYYPANMQTHKGFIARFYELDGQKDHVTPHCFSTESVFREEATPDGSYTAKLKN